MIRAPQCNFSIYLLLANSTSTIFTFHNGPKITLFAHSHMDGLIQAKDRHSSGFVTP